MRIARGEETGSYQPKRLLDLDHHQGDVVLFAKGLSEGFHAVHHGLDDLLGRGPAELADYRP